jgi:predicted dehydrogenase
MITVAVVGIGYWGPNLVRNLASLDDVQIVALCDVDVSRAEAARRRFCPSARVVSDYQEVAGNRQIDAVVLATPIWTHFELGRAFLASDQHLLIEKPLARTTSECQNLIKLAERHQRVLMVGHVFEYNVAVRRIKQYLDEGELGTLFYISSQRVNLGRIQSEVNVLWSFAPHDVSIINYWLERAPVRVAARGFSYLHQGIEDVAFVTLEYPGGVGAHLHLGWLDPRKVRLMTLVGSEKMLVYDDVSLDAKIKLFDKGVVQSLSEAKAPESFAEFQFQIRAGDAVIPALPFSEPLHHECRHFIECVRDGRRPLSDGLSGLRVVRALEAAERSLKEDGRPVELSACQTHE